MHVISQVRKKEFFIFFFLLLQFNLYGQISLITEPTVVSTFYENGIITVEFSVQNQGSQSGPVYISPSVSNGWQIISAKDNFGTEAYIYYPSSNGGTEPIPISGGGLIDPIYPLIQWFDAFWNENEIRTFKIILKQTGTGENEFFNIRWSWFDGTNYTYKPAEGEVKFGKTPLLDQQGYYAYRYETNIVYKPDVLIPILMYHHIWNESLSVWWVDVLNFQKQMEYLVHYGFTPIRLDDIYNYKIGITTLPEKPIIITFDDGYEGIFTFAYPILKSLNFKATIGLITDFIGDDEASRMYNTWEPDPIERSFNPTHLIWPEIIEMNNNGIDFYSHTKTHPSLSPGIPLAFAEDQIFGSKNVIESQLNKPCNFFCYPYGIGANDPYINQIVREAGYFGAISVYGGSYSTKMDDIFSMARPIVSGDMSISQFSKMVDPFYWYPYNLNTPSTTIRSNSIKFYDSNGDESSSFKAGDTITIKGRAITYVDPFTSIFSLKLHNAPNPTIPLYDSHLANPNNDQNVYVEYNYGTGTEFIFHWVIPNDVISGQWYYRIESYDPWYVLPYGSTDWNTGFIIQSTLPVELSSFSAVSKGSNVLLKWKTETEVNNYGFEVERKVDSPQSSVNNFEKIGFVYGNGNSNSPKTYSFEDKNVVLGKYFYRLKQIDNDGKFEYSKSIEVDFGTPKIFELSQNYPNPFNPITTIRFNLPESGNVQVKLFNMLGQEIKTLVNEFKEAGVHTINFDASDLNSGIYIYKMESNDFIKTRKMILIK